MECDKEFVFYKYYFLGHKFITSSWIYQQRKLLQDLDLYC